MVTAGFAKPVDDVNQSTGAQTLRRTASSYRSLRCSPPPRSAAMLLSKSGCIIDIMDDSVFQH